MSINNNTITNHLTDYIVQKYDGKTSLFVYKTAWSTDISKVLTSMNIKYV
jgi:hypothetical protein